jgi:hypothetical protein
MNEVNVLFQIGRESNITNVFLLARLFSFSEINFHWKRRQSSMPLRKIFLSLALASPCLLNAQEIKYIDLAAIRQRTELRHPPAPPADCGAAKGCIGGGYGGGSIGDGAPDQRDPHALGIYLMRVTPTDINAAEPFQAEFKILNTGTAPIELPVFPHLSDLQPGDESVPFNYFSLALVVRAEAEPQGPPVDSVGFVELFGSPDHPESMMVSRPGEWIRVSANVKLHKCPSAPVSARFWGGFWLRRTTFRPHPGGQFFETNNLYPNNTPTPFVAVRLRPPDGSNLPKL